MDTITQAALGAAVGEIVLGKKVGNKALIYGAIGGTIPDLDVFLRPFYSDFDYLGYHRGFSHSFMFAALFAPVMAYYISKWHPKSGADWIGWTWLAFWSVVTHPILDTFTVYGTQFFLPFTNYPISFNSIFIIDFAYTLPLTLSVIIIAFFRRESIWRTRIFYVFFGIAHLYFLFTVVSKVYVHDIFMDNFERNDITVEKTFSVPFMFNILWGTATVSEDTIYVGSYSFYDNDEIVELTKIPKRTHLIEDQIDTRTIEKLNWFSQGTNIVYQENDSLFWADLRFGFPGQYSDTSRNFNFNYHIIQDEEGNIISFQRHFSQQFRGGLGSLLTAKFWEDAWELSRPFRERMFNTDGMN